MKRQYIIVHFWKDNITISKPVDMFKVLLEGLKTEEFKEKAVK